MRIIQSYRINQQLMKQLKQMHEENRLMKSEKDQIADQNSVDVQKLQTDVLYWKSKSVLLIKRVETTFRIFHHYICLN